MLTIKRNITMTGIVKIDGKQAMSLSASIDTTTPNAVCIIERQTNVELCMANVEECRADSAEFEDAVYAVIEEIDDADTEMETETGDDGGPEPA